MAYNYKQKQTVDQIVQDIAFRSGLACSFTEVSGNPVALIGLTTFKSGGGISIRIMDQRGGVDAGFQALPGFSGAVQQPVYTTGVAQVLVEALDDDLTVAYASGTLTPGAGANLVVANDTFKIAGTTAAYTFTAKASPVGYNQFKVEGDEATQGVTIAAAINAHPQINKIVSATAAAITGVVTITARIAGAPGNTIYLAGTPVRLAASGAALAGGTPNTGGFMPNASVLNSVLAESVRRGLKLELYAVPLGTTPEFANVASAVLQAKYWPDVVYSLCSLV